MATAVVHNPSSHPVIGATVKTTLALKSGQEKLQCQMKALIAYHKAMIAAAKKLERDLKKCT